MSERILIFMLMKRLALFLMIFTSLLVASCNRGTCPTFDDNPGEKSGKGGGKTKSGVYPKKMK